MKNVDRLRKHLDSIEKSNQELVRCLTAMGLSLNKPSHSTEDQYHIIVQRYATRLVGNYEILAKDVP